MKALTGLVILSVTMFLLILIFVNRVDNPILKIFLIIILYSIPFIGIVSIIKTYNIYYNKNNYNVSQLPMYTPNGNKYLHDTLSWEKENGKLVRLYLCEDELRKEWNKRSKIKYDSTDKKGQDLKSTLIRYMTSKGLTKDSAGITKLTGKDIINIEKGLTNYIFEKKWSITPRLYEVIWEIDHYCHTGSTNNQSVTQRFIYLKIAIYLIKKNFVFGVGTGDLPKEYLNYYETHNTGLEKDKWWNTHNQYLRVFATFGLIGFIIFILAFFMPPYFERKYNSYYFIMIFIIILLSFVNEDTLETQAGVTFSTFFYALFLWGADRKLK